MEDAGTNSRVHITVISFKYMLVVLGHPEFFTDLMHLPSSESHFHPWYRTEDWSAWSFTSVSPIRHFGFMTGYRDFRLLLLDTSATTFGTTSSRGDSSNNASGCSGNSNSDNGNGNCGGGDGCNSFCCVVVNILTLS